MSFTAFGMKFGGDDVSGVEVPRVNAILNSGLLADGSSQLTPKWKAIAITASADLVALVAGKKIRVLALMVSAGGTDHTIKFQTGASGNLTGVMEFVLNDKLTLLYNPHGWFETVAGEKLNAVTAGTSPNFDGVLQYVEV